MSFQEERDEQVTICAGKNCDNIAKNRLKILYLNREGWFCQKCANDLIKEDLVYV
jgi:hypothetical protein